MPRLVDSIIEDVLKEKPELINSYARVHWEVMVKTFLVKNGMLDRESFLMAPSQQQVERVVRNIKKKQFSKVNSINFKEEK